MYDNPLAGLGPIALILNLAWLVALFFVPFLVMSINTKLAAIQKNSEAMLRLALFQIDDSKLSDEMLCQKHKIIVGASGEAYCQGLIFPSVRDAVRAIHTASEQPTSA